MHYPVIISAFIIMLGSLSGILFASRRLEAWVDKNLAHLIAFSIGVLSVSTYGLFTEAFEETTALMTILSAIGGFVFIKIASLLVPKAHHHHEATPPHHHSAIDARHILLGDSVHNITDGLILVPAFLADIRIGVMTALGIFLHELVQETSEFFVLKRAGYSTKEALIRNFIVSGTIFIGVGASVYLSSVESIEASLVAFSAGAFLYVILRDLVPSTLSSIRSSSRIKPYIVALILGVVSMFSIEMLVPHSDEADTHETVPSIGELS